MIAFALPTTGSAIIRLGLGCKPLWQLSIPWLIDISSQACWLLPQERTVRACAFAYGNTRSPLLTLLVADCLSTSFILSTSLQGPAVLDIREDTEIFANKSYPPIIGGFAVYGPSQSPCIRTLNDRE